MLFFVQVGSVPFHFIGFLCESAYRSILCRGKFCHLSSRFLTPRQVSTGHERLVVLWRNSEKVSKHLVTDATTSTELLCKNMASARSKESDWMSSNHAPTHWADAKQTRGQASYLPGHLLSLFMACVHLTPAIRHAPALRPETDASGSWKSLNEISTTVVGLNVTRIITVFEMSQ